MPPKRKIPLKDLIEERKAIKKSKSEDNSRTQAEVSLKESHEGPQPSTTENKKDDELEASLRASIAEPTAVELSANVEENMKTSSKNTGTEESKSPAAIVEKNSETNQPDTTSTSDDEKTPTPSGIRQGNESIKTTQPNSPLSERFLRSQRTKQQTNVEPTDEKIRPVTPKVAIGGIFLPTVQLPPFINDWNDDNPGHKLLRLASPSHSPASLPPIVTAQKQQFIRNSDANMSPPTDTPTPFSGGTSPLEPSLQSVNTTTSSSDAMLDFSSNRPTTSNPKRDQLLEQNTHNWYPSPGTSRETVRRN